MSGLLTHQAAGAETRGPNGRSTPPRSRLSAASVYPVSREVHLAMNRARLEAEGIRVRVDRLERDWRFYAWAVRRAQDEGPTFRTTHAQLAASDGGNPERTANGGDHSTWMRAARSNEALGLLELGGIKTRAGRWKCLQLTLLPTAGEDVSEALKCSIAHLM
jgi:hypothetical protein